MRIRTPQSKPISPFAVVFPLNTANIVTAVPKCLLFDKGAIYLMIVLCGAVAAAAVLCRSQRSAHSGE